MTYTEWYKEKYKEAWTDNHGWLHSVMVEYEEYCKENGLEPVWDG